MSDRANARALDAPDPIVDLVDPPGAPGSSTSCIGAAPDRLADPDPEICADWRDVSELPGFLPAGEVFEDAEIASLRSRAAAYLAGGLPVHFRGRAGMGKTTLAMRLAREVGRPVSFLTGDVALGAADLVGREVGQETTRVHDRYIQSVTRSQKRSRAIWADGVLTRALEEGHTLVYDEFTRATAETNNLLLSVLEERVLVLPSPLRGARYVAAHPEFRAIFTSNPRDYAGVQAAPDALFDRMITFEVDRLGAATEAGIVSARTGVDPATAARIVGLLRALRGRLPGENPPSLRTAVLLARILGRLEIEADPRDGRFVQVCLDLLESRAPAGAGPEAHAAYLARLREEITRLRPRLAGGAER